MSLPREHEIVAKQIKALLELLPTIQNIQNQIPDNPTNLGFLSDTIFLCKKADDILIAMRKSLSTVCERAEESICLVMAAAELQKYQGTNATITPKPDFYVKFPSSPTDPAYIQFVQQLAPDMVRPHYPTVEEHILTEIEKGNQLPFGLTEIQGCKFKTICRGKREL